MKWVDSLRAHPAAWGLAALLALLPFARLAELPLLMMAIAGCRLLPDLVRGRAEGGQRLAALLFLAYWLPELVSAVDSLNPAKSWAEVGADLRFLPLLLFLQRGLREPASGALALHLCAGLLALWCLDALVQAAIGTSLGGTNRVDRLSGIFGDENLKLGGVLAAASPLLLIAVRERFGWAGFAAAALLLAVLIGLAGARAAWLGYSGALVLLLWFALPDPRHRLRALGAALLLVVGVGVTAYHGSERFAERIERSAAALRGDPEALDHALSFRLPIWRAALSMFATHPFNGVGVRAFRQAYPQHRGEDQRFRFEDAQGEEFGAFHAHQIVLEIASETGLFGLLCWLAGAALALGRLLRAPPEARARAWPASLVLLVMLFPLNTHYAVYSSFQSLLLFGMLGLWLGLLGQHPLSTAGHRPR
jgi:O-antigen ligase